MLWLIWQMWFFLIIAFCIGLATGWRLWSASGDAGKALRGAQDEIARLQRENDSLSSAAARHQAAFEASQNSSAKKSRLAREETKPPHSEIDVSKAPPANSPTDNLTEIKGLGPKAAAALQAEGITSFSQIAGWKKRDVDQWNKKLNARGRISREDWVGQAKTKTG